MKNRYNVSLIVPCIPLYERKEYAISSAKTKAIFGKFNLIKPTSKIIFLYIYFETANSSDPLYPECFLFVCFAIGSEDLSAI